MDEDKWIANSWELKSPKKGHITPTIILVNMEYFILYGKAMLTTDMQWIPRPADVRDARKLNATFTSFDAATQCFIDYDMIFSIERDK